MGGYWFLQPVPQSITYMYVQTQEFVSWRSLEDSNISNSPPFLYSPWLLFHSTTTSTSLPSPPNMYTTHPINYFHPHHFHPTTPPSAPHIRLSPVIKVMRQAEGIPMARGKYLITANCISNCVQSQGAAVFMITLRIGLRRVKEANSTWRCRRGVCVTRNDMSVDVPAKEVVKSKGLFWVIMDCDVIGWYFPIPDGTT